MAFCQGIGCRKRAHSEPDDCEDCMPISKRINKLHIRHTVDSWDDLEHETGESISFNNVPQQATCSSPPIEPQYEDLQSVDPRHNCTNGCRPVQIPGLPLTLTHYTRSFPTPDVNHNNPLLSPMPRQPCPTSIASRQHNCNSCCHGSSQVSEHDNPYYQINNTLYQAHMERMQRIRQGLLPMIKLS